MSEKAQHHAHEYNGEPGCATLAEVNQMFRHYWDPTAYWQCGDGQGKPAKLLQCPTAQLFSDKHGKCVPYTDWQWTEHKEPPSRPKS